MNKKKIFRVNVIIYYYHKNIIDRYRKPIQEMLRNLAWLHQLDYASMDDTLRDDDNIPRSETSVECTIDLFYFRSSPETQIEAKDFRRLIDDIFHKSRLRFLVVEVGYQMSKALPKFPFPKEYFHPLEYPLVEKHFADGRVEVCIPEDAVFDLLANNLDPSMN
jgi:hypothetical protein